MAINKLSSPILTTAKKLGDFIAPKDAGASAAMKELTKNNPGTKTISGEEFAAAIVKGTEDNDNQAAGKEFTVIKQFVDKNGSKLSPEAKKVFEVYKKTVELAKANGQTGIEDRAYAKMTAAMNTAAKPVYQDKSAGDQLRDLAKGNKEPGSISGAEMTNAILKGNADHDNQAAGKEFKDVAKFVRENQQLLSPEAKKAFGVYEKAARAAQAKGETGIEDGAYARMARDMAKAGAPVAQDKSMGDALKDLASKNTTPGSISAKDLAETVNKGAADLDNQSAGKEFKDLQKFVKENKQLLSPDAQKAYAMYEKAALEANKKGSTSVGTLEEFNKLTKAMGEVGVKPVLPPVVEAPDASAAKSLDELGRANPGPGSISGKEMAAAIKAGTEDIDNQSAGKEFKQISDFVKKNEGKLSPEAKAAFAVYEKAAKAARAAGETGIPTPVFEKMVKEMEAAGQPKYQDAGMGDELNKLAAANTSDGSITAKQLSEAISKGARDLDGSSAGKEFEDLAKFVAENQQLLTPDAKAAFAMYEKAAMAARSKGSDSVGTLEQFDKLIKDMSTAGATATTAPVAPGGLTPPQFPGIDATEAQLAQFQKDIMAYLDAQKPKPAPSSGSAAATGTTAPAPATTGSTSTSGGSTPATTATPAQTAAVGAGRDVADDAIRAIGALKEPAIPGPDATPQQLAQYEKDTKRYDRMMELMSSVIKKRDELQMSLIRKM